MSHIVEIQTEVRDVAAVRAACDRIGAEQRAPGTFVVYRQKVNGLPVHLRDWKYPVVFDLATGKSQYDNFEGHWGDPKRLDEFMQAYAVEKAKIEARKQGYSVSEKPLADGSIKVIVQVGGAS